MDRKSYYRWLFIIGALWNWGAAVSFFIGYRCIFSMLNMKAVNHPFILQMFLSLVFVLGIGYYWVSKDINKNHDIVKLGIMAKAAAFLLMFYYFITGELHFFIFSTGIVDLLFAILFVEFLLNWKEI
jgi:hypothetical protein